MKRELIKGTFFIPKERVDIKFKPGKHCKDYKPKWLSVCCKKEKDCNNSLVIDHVGPYGKVYTGCFGFNKILEIKQNMKIDKPEPPKGRVVTEGLLIYEERKL